MFHLRPLLLASCLLAISPTLSAAPAAYPDKPVTLVIPFPPGGTSDVIGRQLAAQLGEVLDTTFVVSNRAGASTTIGAAQVARAPADGYTLLLSAGSTFTVTPHLMPQIPYTVADFAPVSTVASVPFAFVVKKDFPAQSLAEFVTYAKANPGKINNATNGMGSMVHLLGEVVASGLDVKLTQVHYKGAAPAAMDMMAGLVDSNVEALTNAVPNVKAGQYRALAVLSEKRQPLLPETPTFAEAGYPSVVGETWFAVFAPAGTPPEVIERLSGAVREVVDSPRFAEAMARIGNEPRSSSPEGLAKVTAQESERWAKIIANAKIPPVQ